MALLGPGGVHGGGVLAVYMEVVPKHWVVGYWRCTWRLALMLCCWVLEVYMEVGPVLSITVLLGTVGVHGGGP